MNAEERLQAMIRDAGQYVKPSEELRANTLQRAIETSKDRTARSRFSQFTVALAMLMILVSPIAYFVSQLELPARPSQRELESAAAFDAIRGNTDPAWTMVKLFSDMRHAQSESDQRMAD